MDWVHCNGCYLAPPSKECKFLLTSCGHIFCTKCYTAPNLPCLVCKNKCMITALKPNMSPDVQLFFMDPLEVAAKLHKQLLKVLDFQKTQRKRLTAYRLQNLKKSQITLTKMQQEIQRLTAENKQLKTLLTQAKENRQPSHRPSPFGGPSPRTRSNNPSPALETPDTGVIGRVSPGRMRESLTSGKPLYNNTFAQVLGSKITPPPPIFQTPRTTPSPRSLEDCKRSVEYNSRRLFKNYSGNSSR